MFLINCYASTFLNKICSCINSSTSGRYHQVQQTSTLDLQRQVRFLKFYTFTLISHCPSISALGGGGGGYLVWSFLPHHLWGPNVGSEYITTGPISWRESITSPDRGSVYSHPTWYNEIVCLAFSLDSQLLEGRVVSVLLSSSLYGNNNLPP